MNKDCGCLVVDLETDELVRAPQVDVDLHRFKCSVCGTIGFYSARAREAWKTGQDDPGIQCFPQRRNT
jgi:hypothetical protein